MRGHVQYEKEIKLLEILKALIFAQASTIIAVFIFTYLHEIRRCTIFTNIK